MDSKTIEAIKDLGDDFLSDDIRTENDCKATIPDGLYEIADLLSAALKMLGLNDAATSKGALEVVAESINDTGDKIQNGLLAIAEAIEKGGNKK